MEISIPQAMDHECLIRIRSHFGSDSLRSLHAALYPKTQKYHQLPITGIDWLSPGQRPLTGIDQLPQSFQISRLW